MRLLKYLCLAAAIWMGYWALAAWGLRSGVEAWFDEQARQGWQVSHTGVATSGFPTRHRNRIDQPLLADPATGAAWSSDWLDLDSPALWPGTLTIYFPETAQRFSIYDQTRVLTAKDMQAELHLAPGRALTLERLSLLSQAWNIQTAHNDQGPAGSLWQGQDLELTLQQHSDTATRYHLRAVVAGFTPGGGFRRLHRLENDLPAAFDTLHLTGEVQFDTPWDRRALELRRPQPRLISLTLAEAQWGEIGFKASGDLQMDEQGRLSGELALQVQNWRAILDMAERSSLLPPNLRTAAERVLALFSNPVPNGEKINTSLRFDHGQIWIGPLPIGAAPAIVLH